MIFISLIYQQIKYCLEAKDALIFQESQQLQDIEKQLSEEKKKCQFFQNSLQSLQAQCNQDVLEKQLTYQQKDSQIQDLQNKNSNLLQQIQELKQQIQNSEKQQQCKLRVGLQNLGNTCYINSAIQALRHLYFQEPQLLEVCNTQFQQQLKTFFLQLGVSSDTSQLRKLVDISKSKQQHQIGGGDSYSTLINYLFMISQQVQQKNNLEVLSKYKSIYNLCQEDGLQCTQCKKFSDQNEEFFNIQEDLESIILDQASQLQNISQNIQSLYGEFSIKQNCTFCKKNTQFQTKRVIKQFPQFIIIKFTQTEQRTKLHDSVQFKPVKLQNEEYTIIGYCTYTGYHYYYTGKFDQEWITFNDNSVYTQQQPNLSQASYILLEKQNKS